MNNKAKWKSLKISGNPLIIHESQRNSAEIHKLKSNENLWNVWKFIELQRKLGGWQIRCVVAHWRGQLNIPVAVCEQRASRYGGEPMAPRTDRRTDGAANRPGYSRWLRFASFWFASFRFFLAGASSQGVLLGGDARYWEYNGFATLVRCACTCIENLVTTVVRSS